MQVMRSYKHKLRPSSEQETKMRRFAGCTRLVYNSALEQRKVGYAVTRRGTSWMTQAYDLPAAKKAEGFEFLAEAPSHVLQQALRDLDQAYTNFFEGRAGFPTPRRRGTNDSFRFPDPDPKQVGVNDPARTGQVRLPKLGWVSVRNSYPRLGNALFEGDLRSVTVSRAADGWYASFACEVETPDVLAPSGSPVGLDLGVTNSVATSNGDLIHLPTITDREWEKIALLQRAVARKSKGSRNREREKARLARKRQHLQRRKLDAVHKLTTDLAKTHALIAIEDLRVKNMTRSARGTVAEPGTNVAAKRGLNRAILDQSWGEIRRQLEYKAEWYGATLVAVDPRHTSQTCHACGHVAAENRENQADFRCVNCGHRAHADVNAANNTLTKGIKEVMLRRTGGTPDPEEQCSSNACEDGHALRTPERARPSRKAPLRGEAEATKPLMVS